MRVIAGDLGGRVLNAPAGNATRPTTDRVREALFSILGELSGTRVLDLYAGSGALGIEALSRGAAHATFVEARRGALTTLRQNLERLELEARSTVLPMRVERSKQSVLAHAPNELVFADPPWGDLPGAAEHVFRLLASGVVSPEGRVVFEHPARGAPLPLAGAAFVSFDNRVWGDTQMSLFVPEIAGNPEG